MGGFVCDFRACVLRVVGVPLPAANSKHVKGSSMNRARIIFPSSLGSTELIDRVSSRVSDIGFEPLFVPPPKCDGGFMFVRPLLRGLTYWRGPFGRGS